MNILGLEEILKLSEVLRIKQVPLKKAAGEELVTWSETQEEVPRSEPKPPSEAKVLAFPKKTIKQFEELESEQREIIEAKAKPARIWKKCQRELWSCLRMSFSGKEKS